jgi:hypothetical protein
MTSGEDIVFGFIFLDQEGNVTGGELTSVEKGEGNVISGLIDLADNGEIGGYITISEGNTYHIMAGQMREIKDVVYGLHGVDSVISGTLVLVKQP